PGTSLQRRREPERLRRLPKRLTEASGEGVRIHDIARGAVVDALDDQIDEPIAGTAGRGGSVRRAQRHDREERRAGKFSGERRRLPRVFARRPEIDQRGIDEYPPK